MRAQELAESDSLEEGPLLDGATFHNLARQCRLEPRWHEQVGEGSPHLASPASSPGAQVHEQLPQRLREPPPKAQGPGAPPVARGGALVPSTAWQRHLAAGSGVTGAPGCR